MKTLIAATLFTIFAAKAWGQTNPILLPLKPLSNPAAQLRRGDVKFMCREPGDLNGPGGQVLRFTLGINPKDPETGIEPLVVKSVEIGDTGLDGVSNWSPIRLDLATGTGQVIFEDKKEFERINYRASYDGPNRKDEFPVGRRVEFTATQDIQSKLVFARYKDIAVVEKAPKGCENSGSGCVDRENVVANNVFVCTY